MASRNLKNQNSLNLFLNNYFNALLAGVLILFFILADAFLIIPKFVATQEAVQTKINEEQNLYSASQRKLASLRAVGDIYSKINPADLQKFNGVLPDSYVRERLFGELEETVAQGGWLVNNITLSAGSAATAASATSTLAQINDPALQAVNVELSIATIDYSGLKSLLRLLENNLRLLDITSVKFSPGASTVDLTLTTYYYQTPK
jgi:hypothetical protein